VINRTGQSRLHRYFTCATAAADSLSFTNKELQGCSGRKLLFQQETTCTVAAGVKLLFVPVQAGGKWSHEIHGAPHA
jgi:hypothetical protein